MVNEMVCPSHGPYNASLEVCPHCAEQQGHPVPVPLEDDLPTDIGGGGPGGAHGYIAEDDLPTDLGHSQHPVGGYENQGWEDEEDITAISAERRGPGGMLDLDVEEETELSSKRMYEDVTELEDLQTGVLGILWVKSGQRRGKIYPIKDGTVVGRSEGALVLDDPKVSNPHAKFTLESGNFVIWDFGSRNGTYVNGDRIRAATELVENDEIKIGDSVFVLKVLGED